LPAKPLRAAILRNHLKQHPPKSKVYVSAARSTAFDILMRIEQRDSYASELLHSSRVARLPGEDHRLATELVMGVLRWRSSLDRAIAEASAQPLRKLDTEVLIALRLGTYQLHYLERIPDRAAIYESVELVKQGPKRSATAFVNAVLRKLASLAQNQDSATADSAHDLALRYSHPEWLVERWAAAYGFETAEKICAYDQQVPHTSIRLRQESAEEELQESAIELAPGELLSSARRILRGDVTRTKAFEQHRISIQDEASQLVALLVGRGQVLDCCAAPGGKTAILAEKNPTSRITAIELHPHRARLLRRLVNAANVQVVVADARHLPFSLEFDGVLVDAPCSGTGTLARNPEIKWRLRPEDLDDLQKRQLDITRSAANATRPGGRLVYSTCSLEPEENVEVIEQLLAQDPTLQTLNCSRELERLKSEGELVWNELDSLLSGPYLRTIPGLHPCDGFFAAILTKLKGSGSRSRTLA
jgi:16S rRNA (cytosine967-C5)-methyltransferase